MEHSEKGKVSFCISIRNRLHLLHQPDRPLPHHPVPDPDDGILECGSEEYVHWCSGLSDQRLVFLFDPLVTIRDGDHNREIQTGNGTVTNHRKPPEIRAARLDRIYTTPRAKRGVELTKIDRQGELAVFTFPVKQIGQAAVQYIGNFPLITVAGFNAYIQKRNQRQEAQA